MSDVINKIIKFLTGEDINELKRKIERLEISKFKTTSPGKFKRRFKKKRRKS